MLRTRLSGLLLTPLAAVALLLGATPAAHAAPVHGLVTRPASELRVVTSADRGTFAATARSLLAVEAPGDLPGPEPNPASTFRPQEYHAPWTWWMGVLLTASTVLAIAAYALGYYLLVSRPRQRQRVPQR